MLITIYTISLLYSILLLCLIIGFELIPTSKKTFNSSHISFSIVIPFRNEARNIPELLQSLKTIDYPHTKFEIIFINDQSEDNGVALIMDFQITNPSFQIQLLHNEITSNSPKKDAITLAIKNATYNWIVTTDADCIVPKNWLNYFSEHIIKHPQLKIICAPVTYNISQSLIQKFQLLDLSSLIGCTIGGFGLKQPFMCNGANLCYSKQAFIEVNGFTGNTNISSGDDIFLLDKIAQIAPKSIYYLKSFDVLVYTKPEETFNEVKQQRIRWASKTTATKNWFSKCIGILVLATNFCLVILPLFYFLDKIELNELFIIYLSKFILDGILIFKTLQFTKQIKEFKYYFLAMLIYPFFNTYVGFISILKKQFVWKKRHY